MVCELSEMQEEKAHKQTVSKFELERAYKNGARYFGKARKQVTRKAQRKGGNNQVAAFLFILPFSYSI